MNRRVAVSTVLVLVSPVASTTVTEYELDADGWLAAVSCAEGRALDEFYPGGVGCLVPGLVGTLELDLGVVTVTAFNTSGGQVCPITDEAGQVSVSDGNLDPGPNAFVRFEFSEPIFGFYVFWGSLAQGDQGEIQVYSGLSLVATLLSATSTHNARALGHGFVADTPIDRVEFRHTGSAVFGDNVMVGAFTGLVEDEPSLGTVLIPDYDGPNGEEVELDFAVAWWSCSPCFLADIDDDGTVDVADLLVLLGQWGPCPPQCLGDVDGDGEVGVSDLLIVLANWGPCN